MSSPHSSTHLARLARRARTATIVLAGLALAACGGNTDARTDRVAAALRAAALRDTAADVRAGAQAKALVGVAYGADDGAVQGLETAGVRKLGQPATLQKTDLMMIGSTTKAMTASIVGRLVERQVLSWDTTILDAMPALRDTMSPAYAAVTVEQLLAHRSGMLALDGDDFAAFQAYLQSYPGALPTDERGRRLLFVRWALAQAPRPGVTPGVSFVYSNADYALVGAMLESLTGKTYEQLWSDEVGAPLGIAATWTRPELTGRPAAWGHEGPPGQLTVEPTPAPADQAWYDVIAPAGLITIAPAEYARWVHWHVLALRGSPTPLAPGYVARIKAIGAGNDYAVGWAATTVNGRPCVGHGGSWMGFMSYVAIERDGSRGVFGMTNTYREDDTGTWPIDVMTRSAAAIDGAMP